MKIAYNLIFILAVMLLASGVLAGCSRETPVYTDPAQPITVKVKHEFTISTPSNPPTGYQWQETYDKDMLELESSTFEASRVVQNGEEKVLLEQRFRFRTIKKGTTIVQLDLMGPDLSHSWQQKVFIINIE